LERIIVKSQHRIKPHFTVRSLQAVYGITLNIFIMAKRIVTKIGDIFSVVLDNGNKKYFQYVANDLTQLNSDVIRSFNAKFGASSATHAGIFYQ